MSEKEWEKLKKEKQEMWNEVAEWMASESLAMLEENIAMYNLLFKDGWSQ